MRLSKHEVKLNIRKFRKTTKNTENVNFTILRVFKFSDVWFTLDRVTSSLPKASLMQNEFDAK